MSKIFGVSILGLVGVSVAGAATLTYSSPIDFPSIPVTSKGKFSNSFGPGSGPAGNGGGEALSFLKFDPAYGTLTGVSIQVTGVVGTNTDPSTGELYGQTSIFSVNNTSPGTQTFDETFSLQFYLMGDVPSCLSDVENFVVDEAHASCLLGSTSLDFSNTETLEHGETSVHTLNLSNTLTASISGISTYIGIGNIPLQLFLESSNFVDNHNGTSEDTIRAFAGATGSITYTYDAAETETPEPASLFLMGGALLGAGLLRKRVVR